MGPILPVTFCFHIIIFLSIVGGERAVYSENWICAKGYRFYNESKNVCYRHTKTVCILELGTSQYLQFSYIAYGPCG